jgi:hypothetical protein
MTIQNNDYEVRFQVLTAASMKMAVFWVVALCSLVEVYRRFRSACCLLHQGECTAQQPSRQPSSVNMKTVMCLMSSILNRAHNMLVETSQR